MTRYPDLPGAKRSGTSQEAADALIVTAPTVRNQVKITLESGYEFTADEMAQHLRLDKLTVRPRFSELEKLGEIEDSGKRRVNASGKRAIVWRIKPKVAPGGQAPLF